jgi:signal transduction histidine kinase
MLGFTEILMEECPTDSKGLECSRHIAEAAVRMDRLLRDLLEYGRACHVQTVPARIDLCEAVDSVLKRFLPQTESGEAVIEVREPLLTVWADREFVNLALTELVANALKFVPSGKKSRIEINSERRKDKVRLWIADNCESISPQYHERIFGIFERLHSTRASEGTGIGLAVVKKVMERLRGDVGWKPGVREGNRFWLEFPADYCEKQDELRSDSASDKSTRTSELSI